MKQERNHKGLTDSQVLEMRKVYGRNELTEPKKDSVWVLLAEKFKDPLIVVLLVAMALSMCASFYQFFECGEGAVVFLEPLGILFAVLLAIGVGFWFELSANKKFEILSKDEAVQPVKVVRNGNYSHVPRNEIVVGDIVLLDVGDEVPADGILLEAVSMSVNESVLTGEMLMRKTTDSKLFVEDATYPSDRVMRGTTVVDGHGVMKVTMVGDKTEYGKVYEGSRVENKIKTPLNKQLDDLSLLITRLSYIIAGLIVVGRCVQLWHMQDGDSLVAIGQYILDTLMIAVTVIVVAVPEGLPMSVNLSLALSMRRMLAANNLVRKMHACETMGAATVICTDKTGTLTQNKMRVGMTYFTENGPHQDEEHKLWPKSMIAQSMAVNSTANLDFSHTEVRTIGNPTESALLVWLWDKGLDYRPIRDGVTLVEQSAFSTEKKYMATVIADDDSHNLLLLKGAPEIILGFCTEVEYATSSQPMSDSVRDDIMKRLLSCQARGMRTIAFAYEKVEHGCSCFDANGLVIRNRMTFLGFAGISDPVRADAPAAVAECLAAGIKVKIVTGDTPATAKEIGRQIGLWTKKDGDENHITGTEFAGMSDDAALAIVDKIKIMSRARPMDKSRLVSLLQQKGEVVAVTGDGTNDAPALNMAQVGLSMGDGTSVAKHASAITILDNSFWSINRAVLWGRSLYRNIQRFVLFQLTINVAACIIVLLGAMFGIESPLTVAQMLWVNLIMDTFAAMALASLPPEEDVMEDAPRNPGANIITSRMFKVFLTSGLLMVAVQVVLMMIFRTYDITSMGAILDAVNGNCRPGVELTDYESSLFFTIFVMMQFWNLFNAKAFNTYHSAFSHIFKCHSFMMILLVILLGQVLIVSVGGKMFNVTPLDLSDWLAIILSTMVVLVVGEVIRLVLYVCDRIKKRAEEE